MTVLAVVPTSNELDAFTAALAERGYESRRFAAGRLTVSEYAGGKLVVAKGGLGKVEFALHTQHLVDRLAGVGLVVCAGTAGALAKGLNIGDVVVATTTIEHDFKWGISDRPLPRFEGHTATISALADRQPIGGPFVVKFGPIASGDEAIVSSARAEKLRELTDAYAVAFEGAGAARACQFSGLPFLEVRGISDAADESAPGEFEKNLPLAMKHVTTVLGKIAEIGTAGPPA